MTMAKISLCHRLQQFLKHQFSHNRIEEAKGWEWPPLKRYQKGFLSPACVLGTELRTRSDDNFMLSKIGRLRVVLLLKGFGFVQSENFEQVAICRNTNKMLRYTPFTYYHQVLCK